MKKLISFDLDDTLAVTKSPISDRMAVLLGELLKRFDVCVISGGRFEQFKVQVVDRLGSSMNASQLSHLHLMPTCGTQYYRYDKKSNDWIRRYATGLTEDQKKRVRDALETEAKRLNLWPKNPAGEVIEDRMSQMTFSGLGQQAKPEDKYAWDPDGRKKHALADAIIPLVPDVEVRVGGTTSVDVTMVGVDKSYGIKKLIKELNIRESDVLFFGDKLEEGGNDYPVKAMGVDSIEVSDHKNTEQLLTGILHIL
jgi:HAD superfamily hydrolase (TIGR01484 family)